MQLGPIQFLLIKAPIKEANLKHKYSQTGIQWLLQHQPPPSCQHQLKGEMSELQTKEYTSQAPRSCLESKVYNQG